MRHFTKHLLALLVLGFFITAFPAMAQTPAVKNIVLVHGAFADASSWSKVISLLQAKGYHVTAVGNPLTSFEDDLAATKRILAVQDGPVILVGHSYGGVLITEAGNDPKVVGLVYINAFAPDAGQSITDISKPFPPAPGLGKLAPLSDGFLKLSDEGYKTAFVQDATQAEKDVLTAVQPQTAGSIFAAKPTKAAWHDKPVWYLASTQDMMINPDQEKAMAKTMNAKLTVISASHAAMVTHPREVAAVIEAAAAAQK
ncbi:alpha/beta hydrolase [Granulicella cerasi]|uniref:Alpha/beta hydrolase n=1 Tax=Granulicella cerasi TaxID=741063 RepID=A0ABW1Z965_9BACT|nr:alpha/beta hydrolase [Granulicella cerasi]